MKTPSEEIELLQRQIEENPFDVDLYIELFACAQSLNWPEEAVRSIQQAYLLTFPREDVEELFFHTLGGTLRRWYLLPPREICLQKKIYSALALEEGEWCLLSEGGLLSFWNCHTGEFQGQTYTLPETRHLCAGPHRDQLIVVGSGILEVWDWRSRNRLQLFATELKQIDSCAFDREKQRLFSLNQHYLEIWDYTPRSGIQWRETVPTDLPILAMAWYPPHLALLTPRGLEVWGGDPLQKLAFHPLALSLKEHWCPNLIFGTPSLLFWHDGKEGGSLYLEKDKLVPRSIPLPLSFPLYGSREGTVLTVRPDTLKWYSIPKGQTLSQLRRGGKIWKFWLGQEEILLLKQGELFLVSQQRTESAPEEYQQLWTLEEGILVHTHNKLWWASPKGCTTFSGKSLPTENLLPFQLGKHHVGFLFESRDRLALGLWRPEKNTFFHIFLDTLLGEEVFLPSQSHCAANSEGDLLFLSSSLWGKSYLLQRKGRRWNVLWQENQHFWGKFGDQLYLCTPQALFTLSHSGKTSMVRELPFDSYPDRGWLSPQGEGLFFFSSTPPRLSVILPRRAPLFPPLSVPFSIEVGFWNPQGFIWMETAGRGGFFQPFPSESSL